MATATVPSTTPTPQRTLDPAEARELCWLAREAAADRRPDFPDEADFPLDEAELAALFASPTRCNQVVSEANSALLLLDEFPDLDLAAVNARLERELGETGAALVWRTCAYHFDGSERFGEVARLFVRHRLYWLRTLERQATVERRRAAA